MLIGLIMRKIGKYLEYIFKGYRFLRSVCYTSLFLSMFYIPLYSLTTINHRFSRSWNKERYRNDDSAFILQVMWPAVSVFVSRTGSMLTLSMKKHYCQGQPWNSLMPAHSSTCNCNIASEKYSYGVFDERKEGFNEYHYHLLFCRGRQVILLIILSRS